MNARTQIRFDFGTDVCIGAVDTVQNVSNKPKFSFCLPITFTVKGKEVRANALIDSGATAMFINKKLVRKLDLETEEIGHAIRVTNADGSRNKGGPITEYVTAELDIGPHHSVSQMFYAKLGETDVIIGFTFLWMFNPKIDWRKGE